MMKRIPSGSCDEWMVCIRTFHCIITPANSPNNKRRDKKSKDEPPPLKVTSNTIYLKSAARWSLAPSCFILHSGAINKLWGRLVGSHKWNELPHKYMSWRTFYQTFHRLGSLTAARQDAQVGMTGERTCWQMPIKPCDVRRDVLLILEKSANKSR